MMKLVVVLSKEVEGRMLGYTFAPLRGNAIRSKG